MNAFKRKYRKIIDIENFKTKFIKKKISIKKLFVFINEFLLSNRNVLLKENTPKNLEEKIILITKPSSSCSFSTYGVSTGSESSLKCLYSSSSD